MAHVFVVDDDPVVCRLAQYVLERAGYSVDVFYDGEDALAALERGRPNVVVTDLMMPRMNGLSLLHRIRANVAWSALPVIIFTARSEAHELQQAEEAGANQFLSKPFSSAQLLDAVRRFASPTT